MSLISRGLVRFDEYEIDQAKWQLSWRTEPISLNRKTFDLLLYLIDHRERVVGKEELLQSLWPDQFIEESNLTQHVFLLRKALSRHDSGVKFIETVPGRGYRFTAPVTEEEPIPGQMTIAASESITRITIEEDQDDTDDVTLAEPDRSVPIFGSNSRLVPLAASTAVLIAMVAGGWFGWQKWQDRTGGPPISVVLTPLDGTTGDATLDTALLDGLRIDLAQSPFVSLVSPSKVNATLTEMQRKPTDPMTQPIAREVCERTNSQAVLHGTIARAGQHFLLTEEATSCVNGSVIADAKQEADVADDLPRSVDQLAESVRRKLGESRHSIARFDTPLFAANTASLEALKDYSQGVAMGNQGKYTDAISLLQRAVSADPTFATAFYELAVNTYNNEDFVAERIAIVKAYELRDGASEPFRLAIGSLYHFSVTQDLYESERNYRHWTELYPRSGSAWNGLSAVQRDLGHQADALVSSERSLALQPDQQAAYFDVSYGQKQVGDVKGSLATCEAAIAKGLDGELIREELLETAYALDDNVLLQKQLDWIAAHPDAAYIRGEQAEIALAGGRFSEALRTLAQVDTLIRHHDLAGTADYEELAEGGNLIEAGDVEDGTRMFRRVPVDPKEKAAVKAEAGVTGLVQVGEITAAEADIHAMQAEFPQGTLWNDYVGPEVEALAAMARQRPKDAIAALERARPLEGRGTAIPKLRADAYFAAGEPALAEKAYREIVERVWKSPRSEEISLSWLGLARSLAAQGKRTEAIDAYQHFFSLWKHADSNALYLIQAKQEFGKL